MSDEGVRYDFTTAQAVELLFEVGEKEKAIAITNILSTRYDELATYYLAKRDFGRELQIPIFLLGQLQRTLYMYGETDLAKKLEESYEKHNQAFQTRSMDRSDF
jgi:hypothetical protein